MYSIISIDDNYHSFLDFEDLVNTKVSSDVKHLVKHLIFSEIQEKLGGRKNIGGSIMIPCPANIFR